jgi:hypothetical protein
LEKYKKEKNVQTIWDHKINQWVARDLERDKKAEKLGMKPKFYVEIVWAMGPTCENLSGLPQKECLEKSFLEPIISRNNGSEKKYPYERNFRDGWSYHISENVILYNEPKKPVFKPPTLSTTTTLLKPSEPSTSTLLPTQPEITEPKPERTKFMISWTLDKMCSIVKFFEDYKAWKSAVDLLEKNPRFSPDYKQTVGVPPSSATLQMGWLSDHPPMFDKPYFNSCSQDWIK